MASVTIPTSKIFPDGTSVGAYTEDQINPSGAAPVGAPKASGTTGSGSVTLTGLDWGTSYILFGLVGGKPVYQIFKVVDASDEVLTADYNGELTGDIVFSGEITFEDKVILEEIQVEGAAEFNDDVKFNDKLNGEDLPVEVTGFHDDGTAFASLLGALVDLGLIDDQTAPTDGA